MNYITSVVTIHMVCNVGKLEFCVHARPVAWIKLFFVRRLTFLRVG